jgi:hypothetical protein
MRCRFIATVVIVLALAVPGSAGAASGPKRVQALASAQTVYLFAHLTWEHSASPRVCGAGQPSSGFFGFFLLPRSASALAIRASTAASARARWCWT